MSRDEFLKEHGHKLVKFVCSYKNTFTYENAEEGLIARCVPGYKSEMLEKEFLRSIIDEDFAVVSLNGEEIYHGD